LKTTAAILVETGKPLVLGELEIPLLKEGQVLVEIRYSGACHTQILEARGYRGEDKFLPHCLGHEASGVVFDVGPGVSKVSSGDNVVLSWIKGRGADVPGTVYKWDGRNVNAGGVTTFSKHAVVSENRLTPLPSSIDLRTAIVLGCAAPTGMGAVLNVATPKPNESLAVFGVGGVGLFAIAAGVAEKCTPVIAIDRLPNKLKMASDLGATHCINASEQDVTEELAKICPGGLDHAIEATGITDVMANALSSVRAQGGKCVIIGNAHHGENLSVNPQQFNMGKSLLGTWGGNSQPDDDFPQFAKLIASCDDHCQHILSNDYDLESINDALDDLEAGRIGRPVIDMKTA